MRADRRRPLAGPRLDESGSPAGTRGSARRHAALFRRETHWEGAPKAASLSRATASRPRHRLRARLLRESRRPPIRLRRAPQPTSSFGTSLRLPPLSLPAPRRGPSRRAARQPLIATRGATGAAPSSAGAGRRTQAELAFVPAATSGVCPNADEFCPNPVIHTTRGPGSCPYASEGVAVGGTHVALAIRAGRTPRALLAALRHVTLEPRRALRTKFCVSRPAYAQIVHCLPLPSRSKLPSCRLPKASDGRRRETAAPFLLARSDRHAAAEDRPIRGVLRTLHIRLWDHMSRATAMVDDERRGVSCQCPRVSASYGRRNDELRICAYVPSRPCLTYCLR